MKNVNFYCLMAILGTIGNSRHYASIYIEETLRTCAGPVLDRRHFHSVNTLAVRHLADVVRSGPAPAHHRELILPESRLHRPNADAT